MTKITEKQIEKARNYPIEWLLPSGGKKIGNKIVYNCPFDDHRDSTPSFTVYPKTNTFVCYGCSRKGDVITFIEDFCQVNFVEAIEYLLKK